MKNRISPASVFCVLIAALLFLVIAPPEASAAQNTGVSWSSASDSKGCDIFSCPIGCCDTEGGCHTEETPEYCGYYGESCNTCTVPTPYCTNEGVYAQCEACDVLTCPLGCCGDDGYCHDDNNAEYCGIAGVSCSTCSGSSPNCFAGVCVGCDAITCATGCCDGADVCHDENNAQYCGIAGTSCGTCTGDTPNCYNGWCVGCSDIFPCSDGCCEMRTSVCEAGDSNEECGGVGSACSNCEIDGLFCQSGQCVSCDANTCGDGCCDNNGGCRPGTENNFCGNGASVCEDCAALGEICVGYTCVFASDDDLDDDTDDDVDDDNFPACGPDNCLAGCCLNDQCWPGKADDKCGTNAAACENCASDGMVCQDNQCVLPDDDTAFDDDTTPDDDMVSDDDAGPDDDVTPDDDLIADDDNSDSSRNHSGGCGC